MTPATLNDRRISPLIATMPLVAIAGVAGPVVAASTRTGVAGARCGSGGLLHAASAAQTPNTANVFIVLLQRQRSCGRGVIQLCLPCEQIERRDVEIELRAGEVSCASR